jgi:hypothetical protein
MKRTGFRKKLVFITFAMGTGLLAPAQIWVDAHGTLDPSRNLTAAVPETHTRLREEYIWTAGDAAALSDAGKFVAHHQEEKLAPHYFRAVFYLRAALRQATIYLAGPRSLKVYVNGAEAAELECHPRYPIVFESLHADVGPHLRAGRNVIAIEAVRGLGISHHTNSKITAQLNMGEVLAAKIVAAAPGIDRPPLLWTSSSWVSTLDPQTGWQQPNFDDRSWPRVQSLGAIESQPDFFQWNSDAGMYNWYNWPGYLGNSSYLRRYRMLPEKYVLEAHACLGHPEQALAWMRQYWGGMIAEGATSFWESYDPRWPKENPHASLQADNKTGYYISLAHGWSAGPTIWLQEHILGVRELTPGARNFSIRPELAGLAWARGTVPAGAGSLYVDIRHNGRLNLTIILPPDSSAQVDVPVQSAHARILLNGRPYDSATTVETSRMRVTLSAGGNYKISVLEPEQPK